MSEEKPICSFFLEGKCKRKKACPFAHPIIEVAATQAEKPKVEKKVVEKPKKTPLELAQEEQNEQGERVRELKAKKAPKPEVDAAVKKLLELKEKVKSLGGVDDSKKGGGKGGDKEKKAAGGGDKAAAPAGDAKPKKEKKEKKAKKAADAAPAGDAAEPAAADGGDA